MLISSTPLLCILILQLLIVGTLHTQHPKDFIYANKSSNYAQNQQIYDTIPREFDCSNGIDDNGNGLIDSNESRCYFYFDSINHNCQPTSILWACSSLGIHWINVATNENRLVSPPPGNDFLVDIAWVPNGKLYAIGESNKIYAVDPLSWSFTERQILYCSVRSDKNWFAKISFDNWVAFTIADWEDKRLLHKMLVHCLEKGVSYVCSAGQLASLTEDFILNELISRKVLQKISPGKLQDYGSTPMTSFHRNFNEGFWFAATIAPLLMTVNAVSSNQILCIDCTKRKLRDHIISLI